MSDTNTEITLTHIFKSNDMIAESDLVLRFQIRELLGASGVPAADKWFILRDEARLLKNDILGFDKDTVEL